MKFSEDTKLKQCSLNWDRKQILIEKKIEDWLLPNEKANKEEHAKKMAEKYFRLKKLKNVNWQ